MRSSWARDQLKAELGSLLRSLGDDQAQIAAQLGAMGVRGVPRDSRGCAIAVFLHAVLGADRAIDSVKVTSRKVQLKTSPWWRRNLSLGLPPPVRDFVACFDAGGFPSLLRDGPRPGPEASHPHGCLGP